MPPWVSRTGLSGFVGRVENDDFDVRNADSLFRVRGNPPRAKSSDTVRCGPV